jgi:xylulokinase
MPPDLILAHDLGTTGNKATLFRADGSVIASAFAGYATNYPRLNWAEQDPADWEQAVFQSTGQLLDGSHVAPDQIAAICFSGHMQGALVVDEQGKPLRPAIIWADQRATAQAQRIRERCGEAETYQLTGNRVSAAYTAAKVLWIRDHQPDLFAQIHAVLQPKDYAVFLLTGVLATDYSDASLTQLLDLQERRWSEAMLEQLDLDIDLLPPLHPSSTLIGGVTTQAAQASGLKPGTPVVIGGGDGACATVGAGSVAAGQVYNYIGSSSWVALSSEEPVLDPQQRTFNFIHLDPNLYGAIGTMQAAGGAYDWLDRLLQGETQVEPAYQALDALAASVPPGANSLVFLPYLLGERSPHWNPQARAAFVGLAMPHSRAELARAVLEGVAFNLRHILDILRSQGVAVDVMRLIGGGGKSALWRQILADVYGVPVALLDLPAQATALGAAIAGGIAVGLYPDYSVAQDLVPVRVVTEPDLSNRAVYEGLYQIYKESYVALEPIYRQLATLAAVDEAEP